MRSKPAAQYITWRNRVRTGRCRFVGLVIDSITTNHATRPSSRRRSMMPVSELRLDPLVPVPDHVLIEHADEPVHRDPGEAALVEELLLEAAEEPLRGPRCRENSLSRSSNASDHAPCRCGSIPATGSGSHGRNG